MRVLVECDCTWSSKNRHDITVQPEIAAELWQEPSFIFWFITVDMATNQLNRNNSRRVYCHIRWQSRIDQSCNENIEKKKKKWSDIHWWLGRRWTSVSPWGNRYWRLQVAQLDVDTRIAQMGKSCLPCAKCHVGLRYMLLNVWYWLQRHILASVIEIRKNLKGV